MTPAGEVRRALSPMERWYWVCDRLSALNVVARVRVLGPCATADLERAAATLVRRHPLLRVAVAADPEPRFVPATGPRVPVRRVEATRPDQWQHEVDEVELATPLDHRAGPLIRVVHIRHGRGAHGHGEHGHGAHGHGEDEHGPDEHDVVLTASHVIADGTTALALLRELVEQAAAPSDAPPRAPLPPPEALLPARVNGLPRAVHLVALSLADQLAAALARPRRLAPGTSVPPTRRRTRLLHRELDPATLTRLVDRCRAEGVTVHGALTAALALAVADEGGTRTARRVTIGSPVDFRADLVPPVDPLDAGAYVATVPSHVRVEPGDLWRTARGAQRDLRRRRRLHHHLALVSLLRFISPRSVEGSAGVVAMIDRSGPGNVCLSNLGRLDFPDRAGTCALSGAQFAAGISVSGYLVAAVSTSHSALHWNFTHVADAVDHRRAERLADRAVGALRSALTTPPGPARRRNERSTMAKSGNRGAVVLTGASSGLGEAAALALARAGFTVHAGVRSEDAAARLARAHPAIRPLLLDVTGEDSVAAAGAEVRREVGEAGLVGLVNNAGICVSAPLECVPLDDLRAELEVNLIGAIAVTQEFLPLLRTRARGAPDGPAGRIVNVSSGIGRVAAPFLGPYAASQFAKEGVSDALRRELAPLSVSVSVLEPGAVMTPIWSKVAVAARDVLDKAPAEVAALYRARFEAFVAANEARARGSRTRPEAVAAAVVHAMTARRPRTRYRVGPDAWTASVAARALPDRVLDSVIRRQFRAGEGRS
ncbi:SDR family NAD(P)-dependent oxidoreductase [Actinosynnema mirum]|uniref:Phthiocerol/phthiodiolone dimycocerosyl transferase n=2 Tax=Actinosynnema TaxID=40566 RepID=C6WLP3_ACTMD|nr:SDR family NAD(P)-dependent oxidoreductase [Actinosynnema mirum]ACU38436.1 short-chain dehydrogenase/reductase SDR [Actinosynnema mirum DSM 43827]